MTFHFSFRLRRKSKISRPEKESNAELTIPADFICPVSMDLMRDPVTLSTGISYDRESIERWLEQGNHTCPVTNQILKTCDLISNHTIRKMIQDWCVENESYGVERIPTPRTPVGSQQVSEICTAIDAATRRGDDVKCLELVGKIKIWGRESERNQKCIRDHAAAGVALSACFEFFAAASKEKSSDLLKALVSVLTWMFPLTEEAKSKLGAKASLQCMTGFLNAGDLPATQNAVLLLKELIHIDQTLPNALIEIDQDLPNSLLNILKLPICPSDKTTTKASLTVMYHILNGKHVISELLDAAALVSVLLELLIEGDKSVCQKALAVMDCICSSEEGREKACSHPLTVPLIVKKMLRVSELGTELCISALWKLCVRGEDEGAAAIEALALGAFQKLLVVLQVGCRDKTKEQSTELLKLMNLYKDRVECLESSTGFKYLKRSY